MKDELPDLDLSLKEARELDRVLGLWIEANRLTAEQNRAIREAILFAPGNGSEFWKSLLAPMQEALRRSLEPSIFWNDPARTRDPREGRDGPPHALKTHIRLKPYLKLS
jgi:hypothetical protein